MNVDQLAGKQRVRASAIRRGRGILASQCLYGRVLHPSFWEPQTPGCKAMVGMDVLDEDRVLIRLTGWGTEIKDLFKDSCHHGSIYAIVGPLSAVCNSGYTTSNAGCELELASNSQVLGPLQEDVRIMSGLYQFYTLPLICSMKMERKVAAIDMQGVFVKMDSAHDRMQWCTIRNLPNGPVVVVMMRDGVGARWQAMVARGLITGLTYCFKNLAVIRDAPINPDDQERAVYMKWSSDIRLPAGNMIVLPAPVGLPALRAPVVLALPPGAGDAAPPPGPADVQPPQQPAPQPPPQVQGAPPGQGPAAPPQGMAAGLGVLLQALAAAQAPPAAAQAPPQPPQQAQGAPHGQGPPAGPVGQLDGLQPLLAGMPVHQFGPVQVAAAILQAVPLDRQRTVAPVLMWAVQDLLFGNQAAGPAPPDA